MSNQGYVRPFQILVDEALAELDRFPKPVIQFCAPISTGGLGNVEDNIELLKEVIKSSRKRGVNAFDQLKYERRFDLILKEHVGYDYPLLELFYSPVISSKKVSALFFLPLWETSTGCRWEYDLAKSLNIKTVILEDLLIDRIVSEFKKIEISR